MKQFSKLFLSAILGSVLSVTTVLWIHSNKSDTLKIEHISSTPVVGATYTVNNNGTVVPLEFTDVSKRVMPAVVHIKSTQVQKANNYNHYSDPFQDFFGDDRLRFFFGPQHKSPNRKQNPFSRVGTGSGVIINENGYIVTNNHVIDSADDIEVTLDDNRVFKAKVVGTDPSTDLALLQIKEKDLPFIPLLNSDEVEVGEWVLAIGNPFNLNSTVTAGIVSAKGRNINILNDQSAIESFIQTDAAINPGNSGGALINLQGGLVGVNTAISSPTGSYAGYGFAIPANIVSKVVEDLLKYGMVQRGYLGVTIRSVDGNLAKEKELEVTQGVYVNGISDNSAAGDAGVEVGDVIQKIDDVDIDASAKLLETIGRHRPGDEISLKVNRNGKEIDFTVTLRNQKGKTTLVEKDAANVLDILGIELEEVNKKTAKKLDIEDGLKVTKLLSGKLKNSTEIKEGFIITKVDGKVFKSTKELASYLENKKGGVLIEGVYEDYPGKYYYAFGL
jgi:Do/DeqQ family serine protease